MSIDCEIKLEGEHGVWLSYHWYYINKTGKKVDKRVSGHCPFFFLMSLVIPSCLFAFLTLLQLVLNGTIKLP
ncbi:MAG: hypothetical protein GXO88_02550 [Chlorobi bacterium]|nr:hypothetical protein [Chlorobiota bacterium]